MKFTETHLKLKDYFLTGEEFEIEKDPSSNILRTVPQPDSLDRYYESENYLSHSASQKNFFERCYNLAKASNLRSKLGLFQRYVKTGKILDIGAGIGDLVKILSDNGYNTTGVEPSSLARKVALKNKIELQSSTEKLHSHTFEAISMYHVLEHVSDIDKQKSEILRLLEDRGILILALPNYKSLDAKVFARHWAGYDVPRHLYHFDRKAVSNFFDKEFELIDTYPLWFDSLYVSILSARYKKWPVPFVSGIMVGICSNISAIITKEYSSITYVLKKRK